MPATRVHVFSSLFHSLADTHVGLAAAVVRHKPRGSRAARHRVHLGIEDLGRLCLVEALGDVRTGA
jgi:hypothetical protein